MSSRNDLAERAALSLIAADAEFFHDFAIDPSFQGPFRDISSLALMPFLSAFVYESAKYLKWTEPAAVRVREPHEEMLLTSRMRVKLLEDKYRSSAEVLENANELVAINSGWFLEDHRGALGPLKRLIQPDMGIFFINDEMICTTHVGFLNLGLTKEALSAWSLSLDNLGPYLRDRMVKVGEYVGLLLHNLKVDTHVSEHVPEEPLLAVGYRDLKSKRFYESVAHRVAPHRTSISILLTQMLSQINTARLVVPGIAEEDNVTFLKIRFVSLYQTALSLWKLLEEERDNFFLDPDAVEQIATMLNADSVRNVSENRSLRNNFIHYGVDKRTSSRLSDDPPLFSLVEAHTDGKSLSEVANDVGLGLDCVAEGLCGLLPQTLSTEGTL